MNERKKIILKKSVIVAMLVALCFAATFINIQMPTGDMVHLGNFVMIITALLLGGLEGGLVGSLGMGLYDIIFYSSRPTTIIRTFILKFLVGFLVGFLFRLVLKKKINTKALLISSIGFFIVLFGISLTLFIVGDKSGFGFSNGLAAILHVSSKSVKISLFIPIFSALFAIGLGIALILSRKLPTRSKAALFAITIAILVNILGEFLLRWLFEGTWNTLIGGLAAENAFSASLLTATSKIPGSLITGFISVLLTVLIYEPVYLGVKHLDVFQDDTFKYDERNEESKVETEEVKTISSNDSTAIHGNI
ncbi:MAG: ECF transporter S component [Acholeplasmatales bacterium]|nr:ECF transporter S component [Acholeplasmatales bacterium]